MTSIHNSSKKKALILEDTESTRDILQKFFSKHGYDTFCATTVKEFRQLLKDRPLPSMISVDLYLVPHGLEEGIGLVEQIKQKKELKDIPIIIPSLFLDILKNPKKYPTGKKPYTRQVMQDFYKRLRDAGIPDGVLIEKEVIPRFKKQLESVISKISYSQKGLHK